MKLIQWNLKLKKQKVSKYFWPKKLIKDSTEFYLTPIEEDAINKQMKILDFKRAVPQDGLLFKMLT